MQEKLLSIDKIAKLSGLASSALRYYERCGLIAEGVKIGGRRHYPPAILHRLSVIKICQKIGFRLTEITQMLDCGSGPDRSWRRLVLARRVDVQRQLEQLQVLLEVLDAATDCRCPCLCECPHLRPEGHIAARTDEWGQPPSLDAWPYSSVG